MATCATLAGDPLLVLLATSMAAATAFQIAMFIPVTRRGEDPGVNSLFSLRGPTRAGGDRWDGC